MNIGNIIYDLSLENKKIVRQIEKKNKKINNIKSSLVFNRTCIKEKLLPTYTNIYIYIYIYISENIGRSGFIFIR
jgi:hypothetical protein